MLYEHLFGSLFLSAWLFAGRSVPERPVSVCEAKEPLHECDHKGSAMDGQSIQVPSVFDQVVYQLRRGTVWGAFQFMVTMDGRCI